ncbi:MAG: ABC transporter permease, partial [Paracoccaceae bacterium]
MMRRLAGWVLILWLVLPLVPLVIWSFAKGWRFPDLWPARLSLDAWEIALSDRAGVVESLWVTGVVAALATGLSLLIGVPAGRALGMHQFRGKRLVEVLVLAPIIVPGIAVALGLHGVFLQLGLTNSLAGVVLVHLIPVLPYMTLVMAGVFQNHDAAHEEQARSLGASGWQVFWHVTRPAIMPGLVVGAL